MRWRQEATLPVYQDKKKGFTDRRAINNVLA